MYPCVYYFRKNKINKLLFNNSSNKIKNDFELNLFVIEFLRFVEEAEENEETEMMLLGLLFMHR